MFSYIFEVDCTMQVLIKEQRITIIQSGRPVKKTPNDELKWFGASLGLFSLRDRDKSCFRLFIELLKHAKENRAVTSNELAYKTNLSRGTVVHHLHRLIESGIIVNNGKKYILRVPNLEILIEELKHDLERACENLKDVAKDIDAFLGL